MPKKYHLPNLSHQVSTGNFEKAFRKISRIKEHNNDIMWVKDDYNTLIDDIVVLMNGTNYLQCIPIIESIIELAKRRNIQCDLPQNPICVETYHIEQIGQYHEWPRNYNLLPITSGMGHGMIYGMSDICKM
jgi:hypothetical protein